MEDDIGDLDFPHLLSVMWIVSNDRVKIDSPVFWLDGDNSFDPYRVSRITESLDGNAEEVLKKIRISRAFTCHQMFSLINDELKDVIRDFNSDFIVITGLASIMSDNRISNCDALELFEIITCKLRDLRDLGSAFLVTAGIQNDECMRDLTSSLECNADVIVKSRNRGHVIELSLDKKSSKSNCKLSLNRLESRVPPLEDYDGGFQHG